MTTPKTATALLQGTGKNALKRVEVYLSNEVYKKLETAAALDGRSTKNFIEKIINSAANKLK